MAKTKYTNRFVRCFMCVSLASLLCMTGCSKKSAVPAESIKVLAAVRTAVSIQSSKQIERCRDIVAAEAEQGRMTEKLAKELESVFELTDNGAWQQAEKKIMGIQNRYKPDQPAVHQHSY